MEVLLAFNNSAALIGDINGKVRPERRHPDQSVEGWKNFLQSEYEEPLHVGKNRDFITANRSGALVASAKPGEGQIRVIKETVPIAKYSDLEFGLSVRAAFDPYMKVWFVADREPAS
jgi:hypothetical protein